MAAASSPPAEITFNCGSLWRSKGVLHEVIALVDLKISFVENCYSVPKHVLNTNVYYLIRTQIQLIDSKLSVFWSVLSQFEDFTSICSLLQILHSVKWTVDD